MYNRLWRAELQDSAPKLAEAGHFPKPELNPLLNPLLEQNLGRSLGTSLLHQSAGVAGARGVGAVARAKRTAFRPCRDAVSGAASRDARPTERCAGTRPQRVLVVPRAMPRTGRSKDFADFAACPSAAENQDCEPYAVRPRREQSRRGTSTTCRSPSPCWVCPRIDPRIDRKAICSLCGKSNLAATSTRPRPVPIAEDT